LLVERYILNRSAVSIQEFPCVFTHIKHSPNDLLPGSNDVIAVRSHEKMNPDGLPLTYLSHLVGGFAEARDRVSRSTRRTSERPIKSRWSDHLSVLA
jgi:hypothetical protein